MLIYLVLYFSLFLGAFSEMINVNRNQRMIIFIFNFLFVYFLAALRFQTGIDYYLYEGLFNSSVAIYNIYDITYFTSDNKHAVEWGYLLLESIFKVFSDDFNLFLIFYDFILFFFIFLGIIFNLRYANIQLLCIAFFFLMFYALGMQRQAMAMAIFFSSFKYLFDKKFKKYLCFVFVGFLFHKAMIVSIFSYFFANLNIKRNTWITILVFSFLFSYLGLTKFVILFLNDNFNSFEPIRRLYFYYNVLPDKGSVSLFSYLHRLVLCFLVIYFYNKVDRRVSNLLLLSPVFYLIFSDISLLAGRLGGFYLLSYALYFSMLISILLKEKRIYSAYFVFLYLVAYGCVNVVKITTTAVNHLDEKYYLPYKSILGFIM